MRVYSEALADLEPAAVDVAVAALIKTSRFFPTVAEIRERVGEQKLGLPTPAEAWMMACGDLKRDDPSGLMHRAKHAVGGEWAFRTSENPTALRAQFLRIYEDLRDRQILTFAETGHAQLGPGDDPAHGLPLPVVSLRGINEAA